MMLLYVSGPMTGIPEHNYPAFHAAAAALRRAGYMVANPAEKALPLGLPWATYLRHDIADLVKCDGVALLPGHESSKGATLEVMIANALGMNVAAIDGWLAEAAPKEES